MGKTQLHNHLLARPDIFIPIPNSVYKMNSKGVVINIKSKLVRKWEQSHKESKYWRLNICVNKVTKRYLAYELWALALNDYGNKHNFSIIDNPMLKEYSISEDRTYYFKNKDILRENKYNINDFNYTTQWSLYHPSDKPSNSKTML